MRRAFAIRSMLGVAFGVCVFWMGCTSNSTAVDAEAEAGAAQPASGREGMAVQLDQFATPWREQAERSRIDNLDIAFESQDGDRGILSELVGKPILLTFFYSRCQNAAKCSAAVSRMASLQRQLEQEGLDADVRLLLVTYEPQFDTPARLHRFGKDRGLIFGENALAVRLDESAHALFVDEIEAPVNYNAGWVNTHGVELTLIDARGCIVRKYQTVLWDNAVIGADLRRMLAD